jgi:hypothetical protein
MPLGFELTPEQRQLKETAHRFDLVPFLLPSLPLRGLRKSQVSSLRSQASSLISPTSPPSAQIHP